MLSGGRRRMTTIEYIYDVLDDLDSGCRYPGTADIARVIARFAHSGQVRDNGSNYFEHPSRCVRMIEDLLFCEDPDSRLLVVEDNLPRQGLIEVAYLHDVVEDTEITHQNIKNIFYSYGYDEYFDKYIDEPLRLITHDKKESYDVYIEKVLKNPTSAFVKMVDLIDNLNLFGLKKLGDKEYERAQRYLYYYKLINDKYHFIEEVIYVSKQNRH